MTCSAAQARTGACPADSAIGSGTGEIVVQGPYLPQTTYDVSTAVYLTPPTHRNDIAGVALDLTQAQSQLHAVILGRVVPLPTSSYSIALRFADASKTLSTNYDLNLRRLVLTLQASRTVGSQGYHLLTNPSLCTRRGLAAAAVDHVGQERVDLSRRGVLPVAHRDRFSTKLIEITVFG